jgi:hypothetical protein
MAYQMLVLKIKKIIFKNLKIYLNLLCNQENAEFLIIK